MYIVITIFRILLENCTTKTFTSNKNTFLRKGVIFTDN